MNRVRTDGATGLARLMGLRTRFSRVLRYSS
jgi:hypothetical protein